MTRSPLRSPCWSALLGRLLVSWLCAFAAASQAATYTFKSDTFSWESAANAITTWNKACTGYPGDDDQATVSFTGGFTFTFAGTAYASMRVLTNGMLQFGTDSGLFRTFTNTAMPAATTSSYSSSCPGGANANVIAAYWTDLNPSGSGSGSVTWEQKGVAPNRYVVVSWNGVYQYGTSTPYTFEVILYESGEFKYQYGNSNATGSAATIGVQVSSSDYTQYSYNSGYNANGSAIRWFVASGTPTRMAEYRMDEYSYTGAVGQVSDSSGSSHPGTAVGGVQTTSSGYVCRALDVPANTTAAAITAVDTAIDVDSLLGSAGSVSFWVRSNVAWSSTTAATLFDATTVAARPFYLMRASGGALKFAVVDTAGTILTATSTAQAFAASTWVHVAATWRLAAGSNQSTLRIYINGVQQAVATGTTNGNLDPSLGTLFLGDNRSNLTPSGGTVNSANGALDEVRVYNYEISALELTLDRNVSHTCAVPLDHVEIHDASASGLTCTPTALTLVACQDAACLSPYSGGVTGTLAASGSGMPVAWADGTAFTIPAGASSVSMRMQPTAVGSVGVGVSGVSPTPANAATCNFGSPSCSYSTADSGLLFDVSNHVAETPQSFTISAVKKADSSLACVPAFAGVTRSVTLKCGYTNPASGTLPARVGGVALNSGNNTAAACDAGGHALALAFNASGVATTSLLYADVGQVLLTGTYTGSAATSDAGLSMTGTDAFIAAPANFLVAGPTSSIRAGAAFAATVTARNTLNARTPNFGREAQAEGATIAFARYQPAGGGASNGIFTGTLGAFASGVATGSAFTWSEVGTGDLTATLTSASYLGSGATVTGATGSTGAIGRFVPDHFATSIVTYGCSAGTSFTYFDQPFAFRVVAQNVANGTTANYDGSGATTPNFARAISLADPAALGGSYSSTTVAASNFVSGVAGGGGALKVSYGALASKLTAPASLIVRAVESIDNVTSAAHVEASSLLRSGRLRLPTGFGSEKSALALQLSAEYWTGNSWLLNGDDGCSTVSAASVVASSVRGNTGASGSWTTTPSMLGGMSGGRQTLQLSAPNVTGTLNLAIDLGATAVDQSCLSTHPAATAGNLPWLRSRNGSCASTWDRDPSARVSFGIYSPESSRTVHARELF